MDKHMELKHHDKLQMLKIASTKNDSENSSINVDSDGVGVCLADLCHVIGCQLYTKTVPKDMDDSDYGGSSYHIRNVRSNEAKSSIGGNGGSNSVSVAKSFSEVHSCTSAEITKYREICSNVMNG